MEDIIKNPELTEENSFGYGKRFLENVRRLKTSGEITPLEAVRMLDQERDSFGDFRPFYDENRIRIINSLF